MPNTNTLTSIFSAIADAIRGKNGLSTRYYPADMAAAIAAIPSGGGTDKMAERLNGTITAYTSNDVTTLQPYAFYNATSLQNISLPNAYPRSYVDCGNLFNSCTNLRSVNLPACTVTGTRMFYNCSNLQSVALGAQEIIQQYAFYGCSSLTTLTMDTTNLGSIGTYAFYQCGLTSFSAPNCLTVDSQAFQQSALASISFPKLGKVNSQSFGGCVNLLHAVFEAATHIYGKALENDSALIDVALPSVQQVGSNASTASPFYNCSSLTTVALGRDVATIYSSTASGKALFQACNSLEKVIIEALTPPTLSSGALWAARTNDYPVAGQMPASFDAFYVPDDSLSLYQQDSNFGLFTIKPMSQL